MSLCYLQDFQWVKCLIFVLISLDSIDLGDLGGLQWPQTTDQVPQKTLKTNMTGWKIPHVQ